MTLVGTRVVSSSQGELRVLRTGDTAGDSERAALVPIRRMKSKSRVAPPGKEIRKLGSWRGSRLHRHAPIGSITCRGKLLSATQRNPGAVKRAQERTCECI